MREEQRQQTQDPEEFKPQPQQLDTQPGKESEMRQTPLSFATQYVGSGKLRGKVALITGGDSGIGRSTAICFAKEGADVFITYLDEHEDARQTEEAVVAEGVRCQIAAGDLRDPEVPRQLVRKAVDVFGKIDILINNAAEQHPQEDIADVTREQLEQTFRTNFFGLFDLCREALPHIPDGGCIINTASVTAYRGNPTLLDYASSKGAIVAFTRSLSKQLAERNIRVNAVAPGPVWTPLIPSTFDVEKVGKFGEDTPMGRPGQPDEISPSYVFLASADASYMSGQVLHPNGGEIINT
jgi:NAD(P)-dependent dehydrogenase (short-subunit alcohol dehydrogenase family)